MKKIILFLVLLCSTQLFAELTPYQQCIRQQGYDVLVTTNQSASDKIILERPMCAYVNMDSIEALPQVKGADSCGWLEWYDPTNDVYFKKRVILDAQGNSSMNFPKKNIAVDFCEDEWKGDETTSIQLGDWVAQDGFHLKAYYTDWLRGVGAIGYQIFDDIVADHNTYLERAGVTDHKEGARCYPDGFPCVVYHKGEFYGVFAWQLKKDRDNMGMKKKEAMHIHLDGTLYNAYLWNGTIDWTQFEIRNPKNLYCVTLTNKGKYAKYDGDSPCELIDETMPLYDPENEDHVRTALVKHAIEKLSHYNQDLKQLQDAGLSQEQMRHAIEERFDVVGAIDYEVFSMLVNNIDGWGKNWQWFTYDGKKWFVTPYDLDVTFGNLFTGKVIFPAYWSYVRSTYDNVGSSALFQWMCSYYMDNLKSRYRQLRETKAIDKYSIRPYLHEWYYSVGEDNYGLEYTKWSDSYCIRPTICNPHWKTKDDWTGYGKLQEYDATRTYHKGEQCTLDYRIWTATETTTGEFPYKQIGYVDSLERYYYWLDERIRLLDDWAGYDDPTSEMREGKMQHTGLYKIVRNGQFYICHDDKLFNLYGICIK